jgi:hypothetical protein
MFCGWGRAAPDRAGAPFPMLPGMVEWLRFGSLIGDFFVRYGDFLRIFDANASLGFRIRAAQHGVVRWKKTGGAFCDGRSRRAGHAATFWRFGRGRWRPRRRF